jgi:flagellar hook-associated protein 2
MPQIDGIISGLDTTSIINQLMDIERRPVVQMRNTIKKEEGRQKVYFDLVSRLSSLKADIDLLAKLSTFNSRQASSSNENVLAASVTSSAATGSFTFTVGHLATTDQALSNGFVDKDTTAVGAGTLTFKVGDGFLDKQTPLSFLNGQAGVDRGKIKVTDRAGKVAIIDLSTVISVQDVLDKINANTATQVTARIGNRFNDSTATPDSIVLVDASGGTGNFSVENVGGNTTATDLGIAQSVAATKIQGSDINRIALTTRLDLLNDGNGVRRTSGSDFTIAVNGGGAVGIDISSATTLQDVKTAIQAAQPTLTVNIDANNNRLSIVDSVLGGDITVTDISGAAADLGINKTVNPGDTLTGDAIIASLNSVLARSIDGGAGVTTNASGSNDFTITVSTGASFGVDLDSTVDYSIQDIIDRIKSASTATDASFIVRVNDAGTGLYMKDSLGGSVANISVADISGAAADLNINKTGSGSTLVGDDADRQFVSTSTKLSALNGGKGVFAGSVRITDREGKVFTVDLSQEKTISTVITDINGAASAVSSSLTASVNATGDGLLLTSPAGSGSITVAEVSGGTTAKDLNILGTTTASTLNGSFRWTVTISATDTLQQVRDAINALDAPITASITSDGSASTPYRLNVLSDRSGTGGRVGIDPGSSAFSFARTVKAHDAALLLGSVDEAGDPVLITSTQNRIDDAVAGMTLNLKSASDSPVTVSVSTDLEGIADEVNDFVTNFNSIVEFIGEATQFDPETGEKGPLLGDSTVRVVESELYRYLQRRVRALPTTLDRLAQVGLSVDQKGKLQFDRDKFLDKLKSNEDGVKKLFVSGPNIATGTDLATLRGGLGVRIKEGVDFEVRTRSGAKFNVSLTGIHSIQGVISAIRNAPGNSSVTASIKSDGTGLQLVDDSVGTNNLQVAAVGGSNAARDLGILETAKTASGSSSTTLSGAAINLNGFASIYSARLDYLTRNDGLIDGTTDRSTDRIKDLEAQIESLEERLKSKRERLSRQFMQLETILAQFQSTSLFLSQQLQALGSTPSRSGGGGLFG